MNRIVASLAVALVAGAAFAQGAKPAAPAPKKAGCTKCKMAPATPAKKHTHGGTKAECGLCGKSAKQKANCTMCAKAKK